MASELIDWFARLRSSKERFLARRAEGLAEIEAVWDEVERVQQLIAYTREAEVRAGGSVDGRGGIWLDVVSPEGHYTGRVYAWSFGSGFRVEDRMNGEDIIITTAMRNERGLVIDVSGSRPDGTDGWLVRQVELFSDGSRAVTEGANKGGQIGERQVDPTPAVGYALDILSYAGSVIAKTEQAAVG
jgi:hypothetical protein